MSNKTFSDSFGDKGLKTSQKASHNQNSLEDRLREFVKLLARGAAEKDFLDSFKHDAHRLQPPE